ncbi:mariner transposase [Trichonephila clavipes]|uniref:Mariner transposase n=1 Tax=Trichonephila clavipes TaxID=2585209 RepID=A0A8X6SVP8_TRICX|nr:mariner transposase [Trichonephila clavipes]
MKNRPAFRAGILLGRRVNGYKADSFRHIAGNFRPCKWGLSRASLATSALKTYNYYRHKCEIGHNKGYPSSPRDGGGCLKNITVLKMEKIVYMIQYFDLKGLSLTNIKAELDSILGESAPSFTTVKYWVAEFNGGCMICRDNHRSGRPNEWMTKNGEENPQRSTGWSLTENSRDS